jgi:DUF1680 family protein
MQIRNDLTGAKTEATRSGWFDCSCCPTNLTRLLPSIPGYVYAQKDNDLYVNLFINSEATLKIQDIPVILTQQNNYPWEGGLVFLVSPERRQDFTIRIRIPGWAQGKAIPSDLYTFGGTISSVTSITVNGKEIKWSLEKGYAVIHRVWEKNDRIEVTLPMEVREVHANPKLEDDLGKVALQRGPVIYCAEWKDNNGETSNLIIPEKFIAEPAFEKELLGGLVVLKGEALKTAHENENIRTESVPFMAIPYYAWANRGKGEMTVWLPVNPIQPHNAVPGSPRQ